MSRMITYAILAGCLLDLIFADPSWLPHPVVWMGRFISSMERFLRKHLPDTPKGELLGGRILACSLPLVTWGLTYGICILCYQIHPLLFFAVEMFWCYQALAAKGLANEADSVRRILNAYDRAGSLPGHENVSYLAAARKQVARIVGRDTEFLDEAGVIRACVETVAENSSDGVAAPLLYMLIGGAPLALTYKAINTMDSMVGYKNERYRYFGKAAAKLDDAANFIPSRIAAIFWIVASFFYPEADGKNAWRIFRRDRRKHASPNSAQTESACAGALHVRLAGPSSYFGKRVDKPYIGDDDRPVEAKDILRSIRLMWISSALFLVIGTMICIFFR